MNESLNKWKEERVDGMNERMVNWKEGRKEGRVDEKMKRRNG